MTRGRVRHGRLAAVVLLAWGLVALGGCMTTPAETTIEWSIRNDGPEPIEFRATLAGDDEAESTGRVLDGQTLYPDVHVVGTDFTATIALLDDDRESAGVPFAIDPGCAVYAIDAVWDGEGWMIDVAPVECP